MKAVNNTIRVSENGSCSRCFRNECFIYSVELMDATPIDFNDTYTFKDNK